MPLLVAPSSGGHKHGVTAPPAIFSREARRLRRDRVAHQGTPDYEAFVAELIDDRVAAVTRTFGRALLVNAGRGILAATLRARGCRVDTTDHGDVFAKSQGGVRCDEDRLEVEPATYDLVVAPSGLDTVDDLPGALIAARRALRPDGLFLACLPAAPSLVTLRQVLALADDSTGIAAARIHPQVDVRSGGDLLLRAGFELPVADLETQMLRYSSFDRLVEDLRGAGATNVLSARSAVTRRWQEAARAAFRDLADPDGRTPITVTLMVLTGWAPSADQPRPAPRGSATATLVDALRPLP